MKTTLRHQPAFSVARIELGPGETLQLESGAMVAMSSGMQLTARMEGGFMKSLKRSILGGDSFFISTVTAGPNGGWVDLAPGLPGDVVELDSSADQQWMLTRGAWLASSPSIVMDPKWGGFGNLFGGEGGFLVHAQGEGSILVGCYGALDQYDLAEGETLTLDSGHLVAMDARINVRLTKASSGWLDSLKSGELLVFEITGPGRIWTQTRNPNWFSKFAPANHAHASR